MSLAHQRKVTIVGAGSVGATFAYALAQSGLADEIVLLDKNEDLARGQALDLAHGEPFFPSVSIRVGDPSDYGDANLIVITAGAAQRPGETRLQLLGRNAAIVRSIVTDVAEQNSRAIILMVTNPVDVMTHVAIQTLGGDRGRVFGSGTVLDSSRFHYFLSRLCRVDVHNVHGYILGEHGDSEFAAWSMTNVAGIPIDQFCPADGQSPIRPEELQKIEQNVRDSAYHIIDYKGATCYAVGLALVRIAAAVLRGESRVLTVSTELEGEFGLHDVCLSVPSIVSTRGVERVVDCKLSNDEMASLQSSAAILKGAIEQLGGGA